MERLLYISRAKHRFTLTELDHLLADARRANAAMGVTGLLIAGGNRFLQAIEGPEDAIISVFAHIVADPRHSAVMTLVREPIAERAFADWAMAYRAGGPADADADLSAMVETMVAPIADARLREYFTAFAQIHGRSSAHTAVLP